jgi:hypothetical protein
MGVFRIPFDLERVWRGRLAGGRLSGKREEVDAENQKERSHSVPSSQFESLIERNFQNAGGIIPQDE